MPSDTPLKDAKEAGIKCVGYRDPGTGEQRSRIPNQAEVDQEERDRLTFDQIKADDIIQARMSGSTTLLELVEPYSEEERGTWPTQEAEARAWLIDNKAPCIMIRRIAYHRGITMDVMVEKIMGSVEVFQYVAGDILGVQQKVIDDIETS